MPRDPKVAQARREFREQVSVIVEAFLDKEIDALEAIERFGLCARVYAYGKRK
jgi:hypothetical protein